MDTKLTPEKKFISKYLAQRFIGEEASEDECDKETEFILEYITQSLLATVPEKLKEEIAKLIFKFIKDFDNESHEYPITILADQISEFIQRSTAQAVQEAVKKNTESLKNGARYGVVLRKRASADSDNGATWIYDRAKNIVRSTDLSFPDEEGWIVFLSKGQALKEEG